MTHFIGKSGYESLRCLFPSLTYCCKKLHPLWTSECDGSFHLQPVPAPVGHSPLPWSPSTDSSLSASQVYFICLAFLYTALTKIELSYATSSILQASDDKRFYVVGKKLASMQLMAFFFSSFVTPSDIENVIRNRTTVNWDRIKAQTLPFDCWGSCAFHLNSVLHMHGCILVFSYNEHALHVRLWHKLGQAFKFFASHIG